MGSAARTAKEAAASSAALAAHESAVPVADPMGDGHEVIDRAVSVVAQDETGAGSALYLRDFTIVVEPVDRRAEVPHLRPWTFLR
jgi:hypothetical protein